MLKITDVIEPEIISSQEFADILNANCSMKTEGTRTLSQAEIATVKVVRLEKQVAALEKRVAMLIEALTAGK